MRIDYDALNEAYRHSLNNVLRGFHAGEHHQPFLETWVPDEDDARSLAALLEAAAAGQVTELEVAFGARSLGVLSKERIASIAAVYGASALTDGDDGQVRLAITFDGRTHARAGGEAASAPAPEAKRTRRSTGSGGDAIPFVPRKTYDDALHAQTSLAYQGRTELPGAQRVSAPYQGATLTLWIDPARTIVAARHEGGSPETAALLEALCRVVESLPLREAADHGAARLELALRGRTESRPVAGILTPSNADPRIAACEALLRTLAQLDESTEGALPLVNEFVPASSAAWSQASLDEREARVREALRTIAPGLGLPVDEVVLTEIHGDTRLIVALPASVAAGERSPILFALERRLKAMIDENLTVYLEEMNDKNRLRRLVVKPSTASS